MDSVFFFSDDFIIIGGTREEGNYNNEVSAEVQQAILERAGKVLPQIKVIVHWKQKKT